MTSTQFSGLEQLREKYPDWHIWGVTRCWAKCKTSPVDVFADSPRALDNLLASHVAGSAVAGCAG